MGITKYPNGLSSFGVPVLGAGLGLPSTGKTYFVGAGEDFASDNNDPGDDPELPFATIDAAINKASGDGQGGKGATIYVMPGHTESIAAAAGIDVDVAGLRIIGLGQHDARPQITLGTATTADVDVDADDVTLANLIFISDIDSLAVMIDVNNDHCTIYGCEFRTSSAKECVNFINLATTKDYLTVERCVFIQPTDPAGTDGNAATGAIYLEDSEHVTVRECAFFGFFETAIVHNKTTAAAELWIIGCWGSLELSTALVLDLVSTATGGIVDSRFRVPNAADVAESSFMSIGDDFYNFETYFGNDGAGGQLAVAGSTAAT